MRRDRAEGVVRALLPLLLRHRWALPAIVVLGVATSLAEGIGIALFLPLLGTAVGEDGGGGVVGETLEGLLDGIPADDRVAVVCGAILVAVVVRAALFYGNAAVWATIYARVGHELRTEVHRQLLTVDHGWLVRADQGRLLNTLSNETWNTTDAIGVLIKAIIAACTVVVYVAFLLLLSWQLTLVVGAALLSISLVVRWLTRLTAALSVRGTIENGVLATRMLESCNGSKVIRAFGREDLEQTRFEAASDRVAHVFRRIELRRALVAPAYEVLAAAVLVGVLFLSLREDATNIGALLVFVAVLYRLQPSVRAIDQNRVALQSFAGGVHEVTWLLRRDDKPYLVDGATDASELEASFRLDGVTFRYPGQLAPALDDVTLDIPAGRTTALVGPSGAGKSTLVDLLLRFADPQEGTISFGGTRLLDLRLATLRERTALVSQDVYLFNASVRENIAYGKPGVTDEEVERAARLANAHDFIVGLPNGYDTLVGDDGVRLSGGQRQRITLARAVVRDPDVLVLDEATNALDSISEHLVQEALDLLAQDRTVVVIAHRLATIKRADHVGVLDAGRIVEYGTPAELAAGGGLFARLSELQNLLPEAAAP